MNSDQIVKGFWYWDRENNWPPKALMHIEEFQATEYINLSITQTSLSSYEEKKLIIAWCKILPTHKEVKYLWLSSRVTQEIFDAICEMSNLEGLYIKWSSVKTLNNLIKLKKLRHLHLGSSSKVESINVLGDMKSLISLELEQLNKVTDFAVISKLVQLKGLGITGSMWTSQKVNTLKPLKNLTNLQSLSLVNTVTKDKSFDPLLNLNELIKFESSLNYPKTEFEKLKKLPNLKFTNIPEDKLSTSNYI